MKEKTTTPKNPFPYWLDDEATIKAVEELIGEDHVPCVQDAVWIFFVKKGFFDNRDPIPQLNKQLTKIREHIAAITELLESDQLREFLLSTAVELDGRQGVAELADKPSPFLNKIPNLKASVALDNLDRVCEASISKQQPGPGRPKGQKSEAIYWLLHQLCNCCEQASGSLLTNKPGNMLARLVAILNEPLGLKGDQPGIVRKVIAERQEQLQGAKKHN